MARIKISPKQRKFLESQTKGTIYRGGIGSGKSRIMCYSAILKALKRRRVAIISHSYPMLRDVVLHTLINSLPLFDLQEGIDYDINKSEMIVTVRGTQILLRSGDRPDSLRGLNLDDFFIDEAREFKDDAIFLIMLGRIRESEDGQWFIVSSPSGKDWVYKLHESDPENITLIVQKTMENPFLPPGYIDELRKRYTTQFAAQELDAAIVSFTGGIINAGWFREIPYIKPQTSVRYWDLAVSIKTAADYTAGALCSINRINRPSFRIHDIYRDKLEYPDIRKAIIRHAIADGKSTVIAIEDAGQQRGFIDDLKRIDELSPYILRAVKPHGDKLNRALVWAARAELGQVEVCHGAWNNDFFEECNAFTADDSHLHDDMIDAVSGAYQTLSRVAVATTRKIRY